MINVSIGSGNEFVLSRNKPLPMPMLIQIYVTLWSHKATMSQLVPWEHITVKFWWKFKHFHSRKCFWKKSVKCLPFCWSLHMLDSFLSGCPLCRTSGRSWPVPKENWRPLRQCNKQSSLIGDDPPPSLRIWCLNSRTKCLHTHRKIRSWLISVLVDLCLYFGCWFSDFRTHFINLFV